MTYEDRPVRLTKVDISNPNPACESISHSLAIEGINSIMEVINDHRYIVSIKMEIEHVEQPVEDYPDVITAEIPNNPDNKIELLVQNAEMAFRDMANSEGLSCADELDQLADITLQRLRDILQTGITVTNEQINAFIAKAVDESCRVITMIETIGQFQKRINNMEV